MDGVLIDSEPFWQRAQMAVFSELGHPHTEEDCNSTIGVRIDQLVAHWYRLRPWSGPSQDEVVQRILDQVITLILAEGEPKAGVLEALDLIEAQGLKIGLATSSPFAMVDAVLGKLGIQDRFMAVHSAEVERFGKQPSSCRTRPWSAIPASPSPTTNCAPLPSWTPRCWPAGSGEPQNGTLVPEPSTSSVGDLASPLIRVINVRLLAVKAARPN